MLKVSHIPVLGMTFRRKYGIFSFQTFQRPYLWKGLPAFFRLKGLVSRPVYVLVSFPKPQLDYPKRISVISPILGCKQRYRFANSLLPVTLCLTSLAGINEKRNLLLAASENRMVLYRLCLMRVTKLASSHQSKNDI